MAILKNGAEVSKRMKQELKEKFGKEVKFSVRYSSFSGGDSINVSWDFGPTVAQVDAIIQKYQYGYFDSQEETYKSDETRVVTPEGKIEDLGGVKYVSASRDYRTLAERASKDWNKDFGLTETGFQFMLAKDLVVANGVEWKGQYTPVFGHENNREEQALNMAYRVLVDNEFNTSEVKEYEGLVRIKDMDVFPGKETHNEKVRGFDIGDKYPFQPDFRNQFAIKYDGKVTVPVALIEAVAEAIRRKEYREAEEANQKKREETHNTTLAQLKHIVNGTRFSDAARHLAQITIYEIDGQEADKDKENVKFKRFELIEPIIIKAEFPRLNKNSDLNEYKEELEKDRKEGKDIIGSALIEQVIVVDNVNFALLANCLLCNLPDVWKQIGGHSMPDGTMERELKYTAEQVADFDKRLTTGNWTPEEKVIWFKNMYAHTTLVFNDETKETFVVNTETYQYARYVGFPVNAEEVEKAMLAIKVDVKAPVKYTLLDLNLTPTEFFSRLDLTKMDGATATQVTKFMASPEFKHADNEELAPSIKKLSEYIYAAFPEALGLPADIDMEEVAKQAAHAAQTAASAKVQKLATRLELVKEMLAEKPKDKKLKARVELITEMLAEATGGNAEGNLSYFYAIEPQFKYVKPADVKEFTPYITQARVDKLRATGLADIDVKAAIWGYEAINPNIKADTEFAGSAQGILTIKEEYVDKQIDKIAAIVKAGTYEVGLKYPDFKNWKEAFKKAGISLTPEFIQTEEKDKSGNIYAVNEIALFKGNGFAITTTRNRQRYKEGKPEGDKSVSFTKENLGMTGGYWGIVSKDLPKLKDLMASFMAEPDNYVKDVDWLENGLGGLDTEDLEEAKVKYRNGGYLDADRHGAAVIKEGLERTLGAVADKITYTGNNGFTIKFNKELTLNELADVLEKINEFTLDDKHLTIFETQAFYGDFKNPDGTVGVTVIYTVDEMAEGGAMANGGETRSLQINLSAAVNPDDYQRGSVRPAITEHLVPISSFLEARQVARKFIEDNDLGGGNWDGGQIYENGKQIAYVSYNGRVWSGIQNGSTKNEEIKFEEGGDIHAEPKEILVKLTWENETEPILFKRRTDGFYDGKSYLTGGNYTYTLNTLKEFNKQNKYAQGGPVKEKFTSLAPDGTIFVRFGSHRTSDKVNRQGITQISFYNFYTGGSAGQSLHLINEKDFKKIEGITGVSGPYKKLTSPGMKWSARVSEAYHNDAKAKALYDAYYNLNDEYAHLDKKADGGNYVNSKDFTSFEQTAQTIYKKYHGNSKYLKSDQIPSFEKDIFAMYKKYLGKPGTNPEINKNKFLDNILRYINQPAAEFIIENVGRYVVFSTEIMSDGGNVSPNIGSFIITVPSGRKEFLTDDKEYDFTSFIASKLTKKWHGHGPFDVRLKEKLSEKRSMFSITVPKGKEDLLSADNEYDFTSFIARELTKKWHGNGAFDVTAVEKNAVGGSMYGGAKVPTWQSVYEKATKAPFAVSIDGEIYLLLNEYNTVAIAEKELDKHDYKHIKILYLKGRKAATYVKETERKAETIRIADAGWLTDWYTKNASKADQQLILTELLRRKSAGELKDYPEVKEWLKMETELMANGGSCGCTHTLEDGGPIEIGDSINITDKKSLVNGKTGIVTNIDGNELEVKILTDNGANTVIVRKSGAKKILKDGGLYEGPSHDAGGIDVVIDGVKPVEVEGDEYHICAAARKSPKVYNFVNKTVKEILDALFEASQCEFNQGEANSGDFIICKRVVTDDAPRTIEGTCEEIINTLQAEKACNVSNTVAAE